MSRYDKGSFPIVDDHDIDEAYRNRKPKHNVGQQFHQLPMFMSAREIRGGWQPLVGDVQSVQDHIGWRREKPDEVWDRKYQESENPRLVHDEPTGVWSREDRPLRDEILERGVEKPVHLQVPDGDDTKPQVLGGHHRIAVMNEHKPDELMPVLFHDGIFSAQSKTSGYGYS